MGQKLIENVGLYYTLHGRDTYEEPTDNVRNGQSDEYMIRA